MEVVLIASPGSKRKLVHATTQENQGSGLNAQYIFLKKKSLVANSAHQLKYSSYKGDMSSDGGPNPRSAPYEASYPRPHHITRRIASPYASI